jgi:uncharacterized repeat protein (TIGR01451 family)
VQYLLDLFQEGECQATGAVVTDVLPSGVQFVTAESEQGTWKYDPTSRLVTFQLGHLTSGSITELTVTVLPLQAGILTNRAEVRMNGPEVSLDNNNAEAVTVVSQDPGPAMPPHLSLQMAYGMACELRLTGQAGVNYAIQSSHDLLTWNSLTNACGSDWKMPLAPSGSDAAGTYYRAQALR